MKNQFFQLVFIGEEAFIHFFPAEDGGRVLTAKEVTEYLDARKFTGYDLKELNKCIQAQEESETSVGAWDGIEVAEAMDYSISLDKMKVTCRFYPPSINGRKMDKNEIIGDLVFHKIKFGIMEDVVEEFVNNRQYCTDYVIAIGKQPRHGTDAKIEYFFNTNRSLQPKRNEDGSVDYKELNTISHVHEGDLLARLIPEDPGESGQNVLGEEIKPRTVRTAKLEYGKNIAINEDKTEITSEVTGHAALTQGKVFVSNVYEVGADVDNSIGNIVYDGSVSVKGNVKAGFSIKAEGDVVIEGVVENAYIEAGGQIIVKSGIHGMHKGIMKAGTNVIAKFIENAKVTAGGYVEAEIILNSDVAANGAVRAHGKKGLINGGTVRAGSTIEAENLGTEMGTFTVLEVGVDPDKKMRYVELQKLIAQSTKELDDMKVILDNYSKILKSGNHLPADKMKYVQNLAYSYKVKAAEIEPLREEMRAIHLEMMQANQSYVQVNNKAHPGVNIAISDMTYNVKTIISYSKFKREDGEIKVIPQ